MPSSRAPTFRGLAVAARIYIPAVVGVAVLAAVVEVGIYAGSELDPALLAIAAGLCAAGNLFEVFAPANFSFQPNLIVFFGASLLLPPWAVAVLAVVSFLPGWLVHHFRWYMVAFNIANYTLAGMAAIEVMGIGGSLGPNWTPGLATTAALVGAAVTFVLVNHSLIAGVVTLARGRSLRNSVLDMAAGVPIDIALAVTGASLAALWASAPPLALLVAGPVVLIYRALWVPLLEHKSRTDPKTGLYNSEYLTKELEDALALARRRGSGLSVVMIDLDQLRMINNRHGHLAGDQMIRAVADVAAAAANDHDGVAARFGGDELCMLLPQEPLESASRIAENLRARIEEIILPLDDLAGSVLAITVSAGIASYPEHADSVEGLLQAADTAVYDAKLGGRNRARTALTPTAREVLELGYSRAVPADAHEPPLGEPVRADSAGRQPAQSRGPLEGRADGPAAEHTQEPSGKQFDPRDAAPAEEAAATPAPRQRLIALYIGLLWAGVALVGVLAKHWMISDSPWLFPLLVGSVVLADAVRIDVFERANLSPAAVPELALAFLFGPLGPIAAEGVIALSRFARKDPLLKWSFDFGALSLAGAAAAATFSSFGDRSSGAVLGIAALSGIVYYAVNSGLLAIVMGVAESRSPLPVWRERLAWMTPHYLMFGLLAGTFVISERALGLYALAVFGLPMLMVWIAEKQYLDRSRSTVTELRASNDELEAANARLRLLLEENQRLLGGMHRSYVATITSLARTVEAKDPYTAGHTERVADIAVLLATELGVDEAKLPAVTVGAIIHDIGKIGTPDQILLKAGPLDTDELQEMRRHPNTSSYILAELELPALVKQMARSHHERFDGGGYPDGLIGEEIPLAARILSVADALDAMTSDRPYRKALPLEVARAEIEDKAGTQFCPRVVAGLVSAMDRDPNWWSTFAEQITSKPRSGELLVR